MNVPYKYRGILLLGVLLCLLPFAVWRYALQETLQAWLECRRISEKLEQTASAVKAPSLVRTSARELILSGELLGIVRQESASGVRITGYEPLVTLEQEGMSVHTAQLILSGDYTSLLRVADAIERTLPACRLRTMEWHTAVDRKSRQTHLTLTLYIQQIVLTP